MKLEFKDVFKKLGEAGKKKVGLRKKYAEKKERVRGGYKTLKRKYKQAEQTKTKAFEAIFTSPSDRGFLFDTPKPKPQKKRTPTVTVRVVTTSKQRKKKKRTTRRKDDFGWTV